MKKPWMVLREKLKLGKAADPGRLSVIRDPGDRVFSVIIGSASAFVIVLLSAFVLLLFYDSLESIERFGFSFFSGSDWNPVETELNPISFGALPFIFGTVVTSVGALILATPLALGSALFIVEYAPLWLGKIVSFIIELLVAIPSVAYGIWGLFVLVPFMRSTVEPFLQTLLEPIPMLNMLVEGPPIGQDLLTGSVILAIMILPTILSVSREILKNVPRLQKEGMLALGATKWEVLTGAVLPYARGGIVGGAMLGLARAIGETMAVTMVIGNSTTKISPSLLTPGYTIASAIANQFTEADSSIYFSAIVELGLLLLLVASAFNILAHFLTNYILKGGDARHA
ncbi:phosphate ABC transporter permease subunit PstC [Gracilinema caldarium]|uniref:Phosphate transport system permease protein n=1 Tax=Gracilinema caldarium (strain ATCC 51460 / DSM 7334 / H1) TaxID=744872 RepID=F8F210_GRAC1|nr:phosphate ABC transporter permease subunit PstC [Gracilinema caldarium]AEJ19857.1 phosphate ABC transporter, inner membrane subunit PstC [Gracilinema caldarium DSM 7334]